MAVNYLSGIVVSQAECGGDYGSAAEYAGYSYGEHYPAIVQLKTPVFTGVSVTLDVTLLVSGFRPEGGTPKLRWALCTSDANMANYAECGEVTDAYQIASGSVTFTGELHTLTISTAALKPDATYYLFLWGYSTDLGRVTLKAPANHSVTLGYHSGLVPVEIDGQVVDCLMDVFANGAWAENLMPDVFADGTFVVCS